MASHTAALSGAPGGGAAAEATKPHSALPWYLAAGLVGADIGTSVFYSTGVLYPHVGLLAPAFIAFVCLSMWLFLITYREGCSVSPLNGGAYAMVLQTVGRRTALVVGSLTVLSYLATAVVSALSGSMYLATLWKTPWPSWQVALVAAIPVVGFAALNLVGLKESTRLVFGIAAFHFGMLFVMDFWGIGLLIQRWETIEWARLGAQSVAHFGPHALLLGFASAFLGITGFESAAQIVEEIETPTHVAMKKVYITIVLLVSFTSPVTSFLCLTLLPTATIEQNTGALLSSLAQMQGGDWWRTLLVLNACLTLFAAVNTAYAGATGLMTTMGKQGNLPGQVLVQWRDKFSWMQGYPYVALPFMGLSLVMLAAFPGAVERLGEVYGMAFLGVMISYGVGVVLLRWRQPVKVARASYTSRWTVKLRGVNLPIAPMAGAALLLVAELALLSHAHDARNLGAQLFLGVLLVMAFYRMGRVEDRMVQLYDLRLGLGRYRGQDSPPALPVHVICTSEVKGDRLVTLISHLLKSQGEDLEVLLFHAEADGPHARKVADALERIISQDLEDFYTERNFVLGLKVLPGTLVEVLPEYLRARPGAKVYITTGSDSEVSERLRGQLGIELGQEVTRLEMAKLPKGPGIWFDQWAARHAHRGERRWIPDNDDHSVYDDEDH